MSKITLSISGFQCERCEHEWAPRIYFKKEPKVCPGCKSPYWNMPRRMKRNR